MKKPCNMLELALSIRWFCCSCLVFGNFLQKLSQPTPDVRQSSPGTLAGQIYPPDSVSPYLLCCPQQPSTMLRSHLTQPLWSVQQSQHFFLNSTGPHRNSSYPDIPSNVPSSPAFPEGSIPGMQATARIGWLHQLPYWTPKASSMMLKSEKTP